MIGVAEVTRALVAAPSTSVDNGARARLQDDLSSRIALAVEHLAPGEQIVVTLPTLRQALVRPESLMQPDPPFEWKPVFVRRSLGLEVVSACATRRFRAPADAVGPVADEAVADWERTGWRRFYWEPWLAGLAPGARSMVLAEAVGWATSLWTSLDWRAFSPPPHIGGTDDHWSCPAARGVRLKGRCEVRVPLSGRSTDPSGRNSTASPDGVGVGGQWLSRADLGGGAGLPGHGGRTAFAGPSGAGPGGGPVAGCRGVPGGRGQRSAAGRGGRPDGGHHTGHRRRRSGPGGMPLTRGAGSEWSGVSSPRGAAGRPSL